jgi:hypothetical protein
LVGYFFTLTQGKVLLVLKVPQQDVFSKGVLGKKKMKRKKETM